MLVTFILVVHGLISLGLVGVIRLGVLGLAAALQQSEGGGLGIGSSTAGGMMTARGAANLLTRSTMILATAFVCTSILLAVLAATGKRGHVIDTTLAKPAAACRCSGRRPRRLRPSPPPCRPIRSLSPTDGRAQTRR